MTQNLTDFKPFFERRGDDIARALGNTNANANLSVSLIKTSDTASVLNVKCGPLTGVLKLFSNTPDGAVAYRRERDASLIIKDKNLMPPFLQFSNSDSFVLTKRIDAGPVSAVLSSQPLDEISLKIGVWIAEFENTVPSTPAATNWADYLGKIDGIAEFSSYAALYDTLKSFPITGFYLARNDNALSNYLIDAKGRIQGVDFESSMMKPVGWDICMAAYALMNHQSEAVDVVVSNLTEGYLSVTGRPFDCHETFTALIRTLLPIILETHAQKKGFTIS